MKTKRIESCTALTFVDTPAAAHSRAVRCAAAVPRAIPCCCCCCYYYCFFQDKGRHSSYFLCSLIAVLCCQPQITIGSTFISCPSISVGFTLYHQNISCSHQIQALSATPLIQALLLHPVEMAAAAFQESQSEQLGRHLVAARSLDPGQTVLEQHPYAVVLYDEQAPLRCDWCLQPASQPGSTLLRCTRSRFAHYCCRDHQKAAWKAYYRQECAALVACAPRVPPATVRLAARVLWRRDRCEAAAAATGPEHHTSFLQRSQHTGFNVLCMCAALPPPPQRAAGWQPTAAAAAAVDRRGAATAAAVRWHVC